jgi:hypothetical protein
MSAKQRLSVLVDAELLAVAQEAVAAGRAKDLSAWVNDALQVKAQHDGRLRVIDELVAAFEAGHGEISDQEIPDTLRGNGPSDGTDLELES